MRLQNLTETGFLDESDDESAITTLNKGSNRDEELCINGVSVTSMSKYKITIPISRCMNLKTADTEALIDCGAEGKFVDSSLMNWNKVCRLKKPIPVWNIDGTFNQQGALQYKIKIAFHVGKKPFEDWFYMTKLGDQRIILGLPWLHKINPQIDWSTGTVRFPDEFRAETNNDQDMEESLEDPETEMYCRYIQREEELNPDKEDDDEEPSYLWINAKTSASQALAHEHEEKVKVELPPEYE